MSGRLIAIITGVKLLRVTVSPRAAAAGEKTRRARQPCDGGGWAASRRRRRTGENSAALDDVVTRPRCGRGAGARYGVRVRVRVAHVTCRPHSPHGRVMFFSRCRR
jgi:hypothetical protein